VIRTVETLTEHGVLLRSLAGGIDYATPTGRMLAGIFAALAGYERELMHERAAAIGELGRSFGVSRATVCRVLQHDPVTVVPESA